MGALTVTPSTPMETTSTPVSFGRFHTFGSYWSESSWLSVDFTANLLNIKNTTHKGFQGWALRHTQGLKTQPVDYLNLTCLLSFVYVGNRMWWFSWRFSRQWLNSFPKDIPGKIFCYYSRISSSQCWTTLCTICSAAMPSLSMSNFSLILWRCLFFWNHIWTCEFQFVMDGRGRSFPSGSKVHGKKYPIQVSNKNCTT